MRDDRVHAAAMMPAERPLGSLANRRLSWVLSSSTKATRCA
jgi:hypothetical protein